VLKLVEPGKRQVMDGQVGFSLSWRWLAAFQQFSVVFIAGVGSLAVPFSVLRRLQCRSPPQLLEALESSSPVHSNQTQISFALPTLLNCQPSVKPTPPASLSINCLCVCCYETLRSTCSSSVILLSVIGVILGVIRRSHMKP